MRNKSPWFNHCGAAAIEFAIVLPVLLILFIGLFELTNRILCQQKLDRLAHSMAAAASEGTTISISDLTAFANTMNAMMTPHTQSLTVIFSDVLWSANAPVPCRGNAGPCVMWQHTIGAGGQRSLVGTPGAAAILPGRLTAEAEQSYVIAEAWVAYTPLLASASTFIPSLTPRVLYAYSVYIPHRRLDVLQ